MQPNRNVGIDVVKASAVLFVPSVHFFLHTYFYNTPLNGINMFVQLFCRMMFLICVPLFLILTGYLQANKRPEGKYFKKIWSIIIIYLIYSVIAILVREFYFQDHKDIGEWIRLILLFKANGYSWYINMFIGLFLLSPYLNILYKGIPTKRGKLLLIGILLFLTSVPELLNGKAQGFLNFPDFWKLLYPLTYYFIGSFIKEFQVTMKTGLNIFLVLLFGLASAITEYLYANEGKFLQKVGYYPSLLVVMLSVSFFIMFYRCNIKNRIIVKTISLLSILSLDIYLASYITDLFVYEYVSEHFPHSQTKIIYYSPLVVGATVTGAFILAYLRHKIIKIR
ncbi:acyltransferase family protein [Priestia sp. SB1]|uniref:acyltransferase n=1 Tax=Priestia sp. SB1 TaxID=3132359 RepID=UPI0031814E6D